MRCRQNTIYSKQEASLKYNYFKYFSAFRYFKFTITYEELRYLIANYFERCNTDRLSEEDTRTVCRKLTKSNGDDDMMKRIDDRSVGKDEMTRYIKNRDNCDRIKSASKMKEYFETIELRLIIDFEEFERGCHEQLEEMSKDETSDHSSSSSSSSISSSSPRRRHRLNRILSM